MRTIPNQYDYLNDNISAADVSRHINQDAGIELDLSAYSPASNVLLKWNELPGVQVWSEYFRGDLRPQVELKRCAHEFLYCDKLTEKLDVVRDDLIQTLELALEFEKCRTRILRRKLTRVGRNFTAAKEAATNLRT